MKRPIGVHCGLLFCLTAGVLVNARVAAAQQAAQDIPQPSTSLASQFFEHDFVNVFAFGTGLYDSGLPQLKSGGSGYAGSLGYDLGGGVTLAHNFQDGTFSFSYRGDYRHYERSSYQNGANQNLALLFSKRLSRRWSVVLQGGGGIVSYGGQIYSESSNSGTNVLTNPLSSQSRFANAGVNLSYQQTRRLSYTFGGQGFLNNYNYAGAINSVGGTGSVGLNYRTTARTTIGASYSRTYFTYSKSAGTTNIDSAYLNLQHAFSNRLSASLSGGASRLKTDGVITIPVSILVGQQVVTGFFTGPYHRTNISPSFQASLTRNVRHQYFTISGGQGVNAGNGTFLTSRNQYGGVTYSISHHLTNISFGGGYSRLTSLANTVSSQYSSANASVSYGFNIVRYVSGTLRYDFTHYDNLYSLNGLNENRISIGISFSSKSIPLTLF